MSEQANRPSDCETLKALIPAYSVGATDPDETALVEALLPLCPEAAAELDEYLALAQALNYTAPLTQPPAGLHDKLMAAVRAEASQAAPQAAAPRPITPTIVPTPVPQPRISRLSRVFLGLAAAAAALLIISNLYWVNQVNSLNQQQATLSRLLHDREDALTALGTGRAQQTQLVSTTPGHDDVLATVLWTPNTTTFLLYSNDLPQLSPDKTYQVWLIKDNENPISAGVFNIDPLGVGALVIQSDEPMTAYSVVAISTEPAGGSDQPTTTPIAAAQT